MKFTKILCRENLELYGTPFMSVIFYFTLKVVKSLSMLLYQEMVNSTDGFHGHGFTSGGQESSLRSGQLCAKSRQRSTTSNPFQQIKEAASLRVKVAITPHSSGKLAWQQMGLMVYVS